MTDLKQLLHDAAASIEANAADLYLSSTTSDGEFPYTEDLRAYECERALAIRLHTAIEQMSEADSQHDACVDLVHALLDPERFGAIPRTRRSETPHAGPWGCGRVRRCGWHNEKAKRRRLRCNDGFGGWKFGERIRRWIFNKVKTRWEAAIEVPSVAPPQVPVSELVHRQVCFEF